MNAHPEPPSPDPAALLRSIPLVPLVMDAESGQVTFVGPQAEDHLGRPVTDWLKADFWARHVIPDDQRVVAEARHRLGQRGGRHSIDYRMEHADGRVVWTNETMQAVVGAVPARLEGFLVDITDRKGQELLLWKSEERLRVILRSAPDAMVITDFDGVIVDMNDQAEALFDYRRSEVVGSSIDHLVPPALRERLAGLRATFDRYPERGSLIDGHSFVIQRGDGSEVQVELSLSMVPGGDRSRQILVSVRDLTARRRVEAQLRSSERRVRQVADALPAMVAFVDAAFRYRFVNEAYAGWYGWEQRQMEGRLVREVMGEEQYRHFDASLVDAVAGTATHFRAEISGERASSLPVDVSVVPQQDDGGHIAGCFIVLFDVTREVEAREADRRHRAELAHVSRVATMGELTASIAHELNQPLSAIVANARAATRFLAADAPALDEVRGALSDIAADARRAGDVIASMRDLLQRGESRHEPIECLALIRDVVDLLRSEAVGRGVTLTTDGSDSALPGLLGDPIQLKQVILNLIMNALEATTSDTGASGLVRVVATLEGSDVEVAVHDNGPGLPRKQVEDLFQPFVSRRPGGLGMGLTISRTIVEAHGGRLWAEAGPLGGATFRFRLPLPSAVPTP